MPIETKIGDDALPGWPRGMRASLAAAYIGLSLSGLRAEVKAGKIKATQLTPGRVVYLRDHLDAYLDSATGVSPRADGGEWLEALDR